MCEFQVLRHPCIHFKDAKQMPVETSAAESGELCRHFNLITSCQSSSARASLTSSVELVFINQFGIFVSVIKE